MCPLKQITEDIIGRLVSSQLFQLNESLSRMHESFIKTNGEYPWIHLVRFYKESQQLYSYFSSIFRKQLENNVKWKYFCSNTLHCDNRPGWFMSSQQRALGQIPLYQDSNQHANDSNLYAAHSGRDQIYICVCVCMYIYFTVKIHSFH